MVYEACDAIEIATKTIVNDCLSLVVISQIVEVHSKIMMIGHCTASIIAHYHAANMVAIFLDCMLRASNSIT